MNQNAIAIFVQTPGHSPVKLDLAKKIGQDKVEEFYQLSLEAVKSILRDIDAQPYWIVAEEGAVKNPHWKEFPAIWAGQGNFGEQQHRIYKQLRQDHKNVILLTTDIPHLTTYGMNSCLNLLQEHQLVIGPTDSGGYYLFGGRVEVGLQSWADIDFDSANTKSQLMRALPATAYEIQSRTTIEHSSDLRIMLQQMPQSPTTAQQELIDWTKILLP